MNGEGIDRSEADAIARAAADSERYERERAQEITANQRRAEVREINNVLAEKAPLYALNELDNQLRAEIRDHEDRLCNIGDALASALDRISSIEQAHKTQREAVEAVIGDQGEMKARLSVIETPDPTPPDRLRRLGINYPLRPDSRPPEIGHPAEDTT